MEEIFYWKLGKGQPIVFIHGFCETHEIWNGFTEEIAKHFEVYLIDLPGFGSSPLPKPPFSIDDIAHKVLSWMEEQNIRQPIVIGHSLGGYVALAMAAQDSTKMAAMALFHSTAFADTDERKMNRNRVMDFVKVNGVKPFVDTFVPGLFFDKAHPAIPLVDKIAQATKHETILAYTTAMRDRPSYVAAYSLLKKPILIIAGENDGIISSQVCQQLVELNTNATLSLFQNTAHMAMYECPKAAQNAIINFGKSVRK